MTKTYEFLDLTIKEDRVRLNLAGHVEIYTVIRNGELLKTFKFISEERPSYENLETVKIWARAHDRVEADLRRG